MYVQAADNTLAAIEPATGKEMWRKQMAGTFGARGMNYWESPDRTTGDSFFWPGDVTAINAQTGEVITSFGTNGRVDLRIAIYRQ